MTNLISVPSSYKYRKPHPNPRVELLAAVLAADAGYVRNPVSNEFDRLPDDPKEAFREIAEGYAEVLGVE